MKKFQNIGSCMLLAMGMVGAQTPSPYQVKVLNLTGCGGFVHGTAITALQNMLTTNATAWNITVTTVANGANFTLPYLRGFDVVFFNNNTNLGAVITGAQQTAFQTWMSEGGGTEGLHGAMDHGDTWAWYTANMASGSKFSGHSGWGADPNAQARRDSVATAGTIRANKPEYASLWATWGATPFRWTWSDEWYSFINNPRTQPGVDMLMTLDENTFNENGTMGDHPATWALTMPVGTTGKTGRYFYSSRGHDTPAFADANTRNMIHFGLCWAAGKTFTATTCQTPAVSVYGGKFVKADMRLSVQGSDLLVNVTGSEKHSVRLFNLSGRLMAQRTGIGAAEYAFANLKGSGVYTVQIKSGAETLTRRVTL